MKKRLLIVLLCGVTSISLTFPIYYIKSMVKEQEVIEEMEPILVGQARLAEFIAEGERIAYEREQQRLAEEEYIRNQLIQAENQRKANVGFNPSDLLQASGITGDEMYSLLKDRGVNDVAYALVEAEQIYGVNAILLAGLVCLESGWGESARSTGSTNNMTGMGVPNNYSRGYVYSSRAESVLDTARQLKKNYLTEGGVYYNGTSIWSVNKKYCASKDWADKIVNISSTLLSKYKELY